MLLRMGEIIARNILSWLKLSINCYCWYLVGFYITVALCSCRKYVSCICWDTINMHAKIAFGLLVSKHPSSGKKSAFAYWDLRKCMSYKDIKNLFTKCNSALYKEMLYRHCLSIFHQKSAIREVKESRKVWKWLVCISFCFMLMIFVHCIETDTLREKETQTFYESLTRRAV